MAWLPGYAYRKPLVLTGGASGAQTDFQLNIDIAHVAAKMQADFDDIRFTQNNGTMLIDAWLESKVDSASAKTWAEFPTTPVNTVEQTYYMYYGKAGDVNYWDIAETMVFGEGFEGISGNYPANWTGSDAAHFQYNNTQAHTGSTSCRIFTDGTRYNEYRDIALGTTDYILGYFAYLPAGGDFKHRMIPRNDTADNRIGISHFRIFTGNYEIVGGDGSDAIAFTTDQWENIELWLDFTAKKVKAYLNGNLVGNRDFTSAVATLDRLWLIGDTDDQGTGYIDDIYVRKYASGPPTYAFGAEESAPAGGAVPIFMQHHNQFNGGQLV